jgi:hypothetical protein
MEIMGIKIPTIVTENSGIRCEGCRQIITGTPFRISVLDIIATEVAPSFESASPINPGPFQFCANPACPALWMAASGWYFCKNSAVREIMRPVPLQRADQSVGLGLCDGLHQSAHEFLPA